MTSRVLGVISLVLVPTCFTGLGIAIFCLKDKTESSASRIVVQSAKVASTLWPIAFAAVVGTMSKTTALYRTERGVKLGILETIVRSQTLFNTVKEVQLRAVLAFSPAGGIPVDQILSLRNNFDTGDASLVYYPNNHVTNLTVGSMVSSGSGSTTVYRVMMYGSVLLDPGASLMSADMSLPDFEKKLNAAIDRITPKEAINGTHHDL
ncbi:hypothetical protein IWZ03DRAFT_237578 [Phyllosticta citriasiana]|uniref:O-acyltransferase WSD1 C-terminal domain-containing protein n=1 Tax=Phyllosticta citriasiana TaxID=595635 RepID=A0ABR1KHC0_9PEZI